MKKSILILGFLLTTTAVFANATKNEKSVFQIDTKASKVHWTGKKVTGEHTGYLSVGDGKLMVQGNDVVGAQVKGFCTASGYQYIKSMC